VSVNSAASEDQTIALGRRIAERLPSKALVLLIGNLGAGKTTLAKGIISGLSAASLEEVSSPTFTLIHEYGDGRVYHIDLYRLDTRAEVETLGLDELLDRDAIVLIEWGERFPELWPANRIEIRLEASPDDTRTIDLNGIEL
jgi:tRNA threonylcarbamoyladenosine biosynthesis protein TsaE